MTAHDHRTGVAVLGSTGSVGRQTLEVLSLMSDQFRVVALAAGNNYQLLAEQVRTMRPEYVALDSTPPPGADLPGGACV